MAGTTSTPEGVDLVRSFLNTADYEDGAEVFDSPSALRAWLVDHDLLSRHDDVTSADLQLALELRGALREELATHLDGGTLAPRTRERLDAVYGRLPLRLSCCHEGLAPCGDGVPGALAKLAATVAAARIAGTWERLKVCPADDCAWVFYDESRNRSRRWCSMEVCGNRAKVRAFRHRADA